MLNIKEIAATLAILGSGSLMTAGCEKDKPATETPGGAEAVPAADPVDAEASCGEGKAEGSCGEGKAEGSCGEGKAEGSCGGK